MEVVFLFWLVGCVAVILLPLCALGGALLLRSRGMALVGALLGLFFGPLGLVGVFLLRRRHPLGPQST